MKHLLLSAILFLFLSIAGKTQLPSFAAFLKTVERHFSAPAFPEDSCFNNVTMLRVELNADYKIQSILLADNAEAWQRQVLESIKPKLAIDEIEAYARTHGIKNAAFHFPFYLQKVGTNCIGDSFVIPFNPQLFSFEGKDSRGFLMDKVGVTFMN